HPLSDTAKARLSDNIKLARELGAEIVTTADEDVAEGILRIAREQNATQVLVGKTGRSLPFTRSLLDRLIEQSGQLDIYVVGGDETSASSRRRIRFPEIQ